MTNIYETTIIVKPDLANDQLKNLNTSIDEFFSENNLNSNGNEFENLKVKLFPNPSAGNFSIKFDKRFDGQIIIYNLLGKEVLNESIINDNDLTLFYMEESNDYDLEILFYMDDYLDVFDKNGETL